MKDSYHFWRYSAVPSDATKQDSNHQNLPMPNEIVRRRAKLEDGRIVDYDLCGNKRNDYDGYGDKFCYIGYGTIYSLVYGNGREVIQ